VSCSYEDIEHSGFPAKGQRVSTTTTTTTTTIIIMKTIKINLLILLRTVE
jgi:hypothetical protein